ncbi:hypothetical protein VTJ04DRAFT_1335 [Mycothermus thermophilus]|uniref:uncharacterized protein n=1 Tax=Humicola insolens TaxID=85995 RepID=UPI003741E8F8
MDAVSTFSDTTLDPFRDLVNITHLFPELGTIESVEILLGTISQLETLDDVKYLLESYPQPFILPNFVHGEFRFPSDTTTTLLDSYNPMTGCLIYQVPCTKSDDVQLAIHSAAEATQIWGKTSPGCRINALYQISTSFEIYTELFAICESIDQGKPGEGTN